MFALVDCNNFYASCEKLFRPDLAGRPVVVLSNNDGCIVARSAEAKEFSLPFAKPFYKSKSFLESKGTAFFSSNYALYGDISSRVLAVLAEFSPDIEQYSIDEAFIWIEESDPQKLQHWAEEIVDTVKQWIGINVSVGIARTKTLAKIANHRAKRLRQGASLLLEESAIVTELEQLELTDIWGISRKLERKLQRYGIWTPLLLQAAEPLNLRKKLGITVERTARELNNEECLELEYVTKRKNIMVSRSFGRVTGEYGELEEATATFAAKACEKLRRQNSLACGIYVHLRTNKHAAGEYYSASAASGFVIPTSSSFDIVAEAKRLLAKVFKPGYLYLKVGVMLLDLVGERAHQQQDIFGITRELAGKKELMGAIDRINRDMGNGSVRFASQGLGRKGWALRAEYLSPRYCTRWDELPEVR